METSKEIDNAISKINNKLLDIMNDRGILKSSLLSPLSEKTYPENTSQDKFVKNSDSIKVNDLLTNKAKPVTLDDTLLTVSDTDKNFELKEELLKTLTNKIYDVDLA